ncbi:MAG: DUF6166 domain-containing protein [Thermomicrobiales bacterium]
MRGEGFPKDKMGLSLDVETIDTDIRCERDDEGTRFNIMQRVRHHSPTGMEWGYAGSGPADFALNILDRFLPAGTDGWEGTPCWDKNIVSRMAWSLHQDFKFAFIAALPYEGGVISGARIREWIVAMTEPGFAVFGMARDEQGREYEWFHDDGYGTLAIAEAEAAVLTNTTADSDLVGFAARRVVNVR